MDSRRSSRRDNSNNPFHHQEDHRSNTTNEDEDDDSISDTLRSSSEVGQTQPVRDNNTTEDCDMDMEEMTSDLVNQFVCLGTTDRDVLITQLQKLVGPQLNTPAAHFFLDMNNWNLGLAVGAYFDLTSDQNNTSSTSDAENLHPGSRLLSDGPGVTWTYSMSLVDDISSGSDEVPIPPSTPFLKRWRLKNSGSEPWPPGTHLKYRSGSINLAAQDAFLLQQQVPVQPGDCVDVGLEFRSPSAPGQYEMRWQLATGDGYLFGDEIWTIITVATDTTQDLTLQLASLSCTSNNTNSTSNSQL